MSDILIVDDEKDIRDLISDILEDEGFKANKAASSDEALQLLRTIIPTVVILDIWLQGSEIDGIGILERVKKLYPYIPVIMISGHGNIETAVTAIKLGAYDYIEKPFTEDKLTHIVKRAIESAKLQKENIRLRSLIGEDGQVIGQSNSIQKLKTLIEKVAPTEGRILITGPSGIGKKFIAKFIHNKSKRKDEPFIVLDARGVTDETIEEDLVGTTGTYRKIGLLELANKGTLFIDEICELSYSAQSKILNLLQNPIIFSPLSNTPKSINIRVISASSKNLEELIEQGKFRRDLFFRINIIAIDLEPLTKRKEDIPLLCNYYLRFIANLSGLEKKEVTDEAMAYLKAYSWPGNVRQIKNVMEWLLIMCSNNEGHQIEPNMLPPEIINKEKVSLATDSTTTKAWLNLPLKEARNEFEKQYLQFQLNKHDGSISKIAESIGMERSALHRKIKTLQLKH